jgi:hypothetical protein
MALGWPEDQARWQVDSGRWQRPFRGVYLTFSGPVPPSLLATAAIRYAGSAAALSHLSAAALLGFAKPPSKIHLTVGGDRKVALQPGLVVHRSRTLRPADIVGNPPRTRAERTVLDVLNMMPSGDSALALVADAVRSRRTTASRLRDALIAAPVTRWRAICLEALPDVGHGALSLLELRDVRLCRAHGLPAGSRQKRRDAAGVEYLDVFVEEWDLHVELDGRLGHDRATEIWRDMHRDNHSELRQLRHLRYGWSDVAFRPCDVAIERAIVLRQQGWRGAFTRCPNCPADLPAELR